VYDFYTQKVSINEREWPLPCFFQKLFDYCVLIDYKMQTRKRLARCSQGERTITKYFHKLQELFNIYNWNHVRTGPSLEIFEWHKTQDPVWALESTTESGDL
jgi:hypothetical protein